MADRSYSTGLNARLAVKGLRIQVWGLRLGFEGLGLKQYWPLLAKQANPLRNLAISVLVCLHQPSLNHLNLLLGDSHSHGRRAEDSYAHFEEEDGTWTINPKPSEQLNQKGRRVGTRRQAFGDTEPLFGFVLDFHLLLHMLTALGP